MPSPDEGSPRSAQVCLTEVQGGAWSSDAATVHDLYSRATSLPPCPLSQPPATTALREVPAPRGVCSRGRAGGKPLGRGRAVRAIWGVAAALGRLPYWARRTVDTSDPFQDTLQHTFARLDGFEAGQLHGAVKPSNIGFMLSGLPKLLDFGLAREPERRRHPGWDAALPDAGGALGPAGRARRRRLVLVRGAARDGGGCAPVRNDRA